MISHASDSQKHKLLFVKDMEGIDLIVDDPNAVVIDLSYFNIVDNITSPYCNVIHRGRETRRCPHDSFLMAKVASRRCKQIKLEFLQKCTNVFEQSFKVKTNIKRGKDRKAITKVYVCYGFRKHPKFCKVSEYAFNLKKCTAEQANAMNETIKNLVYKIESRANDILGNMPDLEMYDFMNEFLELPTFTNQKLCTQFSIGKDYWSAMHIDNDYFHTTLSCFHSDPEKYKDCILYHFVFPDYGLAVPLRHGDIVVFDPRVPHCCTNPRVEGSYICSAYVSKKTALSHAAYTH
jgi:hypothetical protein